MINAGFANYFDIGLTHEFLTILIGYEDKTSCCMDRRRRSSIIWQYFTISTLKNSICNICMTVIKGTNGTNQQKHLRCKHKLVYDEFRLHQLAVRENFFN